jgi:hypothetical protein
MKSIKRIKNKVILLNGNLVIVDDIRLDEGKILISKLESNAEIEEINLSDLDVVMEGLQILDFDFEQARLKAVDIMNQTRYFDNHLSKERDNSVL